MSLFLLGTATSSVSSPSLSAQDVDLELSFLKVDTSLDNSYLIKNGLCRGGRNYMNKHLDVPAVLCITLESFLNIRHKICHFRYEMHSL